MSTTQTPAGRVTSPVARPAGLPLITEAHWRQAAEAVTGQPTEALRVTAVARAIADAELRGAQNVGTGGASREGTVARPGHQPITEFWFETPPSQDELRARLTAAERAAHSQHVEPHPFCYLCPKVRRAPAENHTTEPEDEDEGACPSCGRDVSEPGQCFDCAVESSYVGGLAPRFGAEA